MSTIFFVVVIVGFGRSFYLKSYFDFPELSVYLYLHGIALSAWFTLALIQPWLIKSRRTKLHRKLGIVGVLLAVSVVVTGVLTVTLRDAPEIDEFPARAGGNLASLIMFASCVTLAVWCRHKPDTHKRLMLLASIPILAPALDRLARIPVLNEFFGEVLFWFPEAPEVAFATLGFLFFLLTVVVNDLITLRRIQQGTVLGMLAIFIISPAVTYAFLASGAWVTFVHWVAF
jgi:hypothetical protein